MLRPRRARRTEVAWRCRQSGGPGITSSGRSSGPSLPNFGSPGGGGVGGKQGEEVHPKVCNGDWTARHKQLLKDTNWYEKDCDKKVPGDPYLTDCCFTEEEKKTLICTLVNVLNSRLLSENPRLRDCLENGWLKATIVCDPDPEKKNPRNTGSKKGVPFNSGFTPMNEWLKDIVKSGERPEERRVKFIKEQLSVTDPPYDLAAALVALCVQNTTLLDWAYLDVLTILGYKVDKVFDCDFWIVQLQSWLNKYKIENKGLVDDEMGLPEFFRKLCAGELIGHVYDRVESNLFEFNPCTGEVKILQRVSGYGSDESLYDPTRQTTSKVKLTKEKLASSPCGALVFNRIKVDGEGGDLSDVGLGFIRKYTFGI